MDTSRRFLSLGIRRSKSSSSLPQPYGEIAAVRRFILLILGQFLKTQNLQPKDAFTVIPKLDNSALSIQDDWHGSTTRHPSPPYFFFVYIGYNRPGGLDCGACPSPYYLGALTARLEYKIWAGFTGWHPADIPSRR